MYLLIDNSDVQKSKLVLFKDKFQKEIVLNKKKFDLLQAIFVVLRKFKIQPAELEGIITVVGEGGFTSTRVATTMANIFVYVFGKKATTVTKKEAENLLNVEKKIKKQKNGRFILPFYSGKPNIRKTTSFVKLVK